jgi:glucose/arabinose dehydrogenase
MRHILWPALILPILTLSITGADTPPGKVLLTGIKGLRSAIVGPGGKVYVAVAGEPGKEGTGSILVVEDGKTTPFATGLDEPTGMIAFAEKLFVTDRSRVWQIDKTGKAKVHTAEKVFPGTPPVLQSITVGEAGALYISALEGKDTGPTIYRLPGQMLPFGPPGKLAVIADAKKTPTLKSPRSIVLDGASFVLALDNTTGQLLRIKVSDGSAEEVAGGLGAASGVVWDWFGRLYVGDTKAGKVSVIGRPGEKPVPVASGFQSITTLALGPAGKSILVVDGEAGTLTALPTGVPGQPVDETPLPITSEIAFPNLKWTDWKSEDKKGAPIPLRPLVLTHAGDGSNRVFVATEHGVIHTFPNNQKADKTDVFLDIQERVSYDDKQNEEGFLGLTFHPKFKENGEFFVFYTVKTPKLTNVLSRFKVSKDNPNKADPASEEELLRITKPFWNHDGGTICFGPDGFLYVAIGDGGAANDPFNHGQNLVVIFGKVLRIDVDHKAGDRKYAIPQDNPFVNKEGARPEIWCYGLRNPWRMAFDRKTGKLWTSDVGQNLYEEIDILVAGGNYGWNLREGLHPFGDKGVGPRKDLIEPIWEYHHDVGKSLTGGLVYRGKRLPELEGLYLYADYVSSRIWGLRYDEGKGRVVGNHPIGDPNQPVMSFGEDEEGDAYFLVAAASGKGIYRFVPARR